MVPSSSVAPLKGQRLPLDVQKLKLKGLSLDEISQVSSKTVRPSWYSPGVERHAVRFMQPYLQAYLEEKKLWGSLHQSWLGCLLKLEHMVLVREASDPSHMWLPIACVPGSCVVAWPVRSLAKTSKEGACLTAYELCQGVSVDSTFLTAVCLGRWEAMPF
eukprot:9348904-Alexandrium_andersonii.AAC.1